MISDTSKNVLIVDDNTSLLHGLKFALENNDFKVLAANNYFEAVQILDTIRPDLIISDINMPGKNGFDLLEYLRKSQTRANVPLIFLTAFHNPELMEKARVMGCEELVYKPVKVGALLSIVRSRLNRAQELETLYTTKTLLNTIEVMAIAIESRDRYTGGHVRRVMNYSVSLARVLDWPTTKIQEVQLVAILHDLGKVVVPDSILNKAGPLNDEEWQIIQKHPVEGEKLIAPLGYDNLPTLSEGLRHHHEKYDGSGYPDGLAGEKIPPVARLLTIADAYDAMTSDRSYRKGMSSNKALQIIEKNIGKHFDPDMATAFINDLLSQQKGEKNECN
ncbi:MAG: response regulator [Chloroflexi bacterium]|nr:response regulator [Chloroflexota bacterium]